MAYALYRRKKRLVHVYYYDRSSGKLVQLPRKQTKHLDGKPQDEVTAWVEKWEKSHGIAKERASKEVLKEDDKLLALWRQYQSHRMSTRNRRDRTAEKESALFERDIVSFFVSMKQLKDPATWHDEVPNFHAHLFGKKFADRTIQKILWTLERFGKHLVFQRYMTFTFVVQIPSRKNNKTTPLKVKKTPDEIIKFVKNLDLPYKDIDFKLAVLLSYFAALRPSELFALSKSDLITGDEAQALATTSEGFKKFKLGSRLSVSVTKTLGDYLNAKPEEIMKTDSSSAVVNIWNVEAAKMIAGLVKDRPKGRLFNFSHGWLERAWRVYVKPKLEATPHDLRRASCLYLGRTVRLDLTLLQEHMRHSEIETTMLYTREPKKIEKRSKVVQDFDDVA